MNILRLSLCNLRFRALATFFNVVVLALGIATIVTLLNLSREVEDRFNRDLRGIDLVAGAKGSPIQLILSSVFHLDAPNGNISADEAEKLARNPLIETAIPVALGDSFRGFRIVGTTPDYPKHYDATLAEGNYWSQPMQAVLGSEVARSSGLKVGDRFLGGHGLIEGGEVHTQFPYTITGVLAPTGTVIDRLALTDVASVWAVHEHHDEHGHDEHGHDEHGHDEHGHDEHGHDEHGHDEHGHDEHGHDEHDAPHAETHGREITALLIHYKSDFAAVKLPSLVNRTSSMQAAAPALEMAHLLHIVGIGGETIRFFGGAIMAIAAVGFFVTLWGAVADRSYDIALMRSLGATRRKIFCFVLAEGMTLGLLGVLAGLLLGHGFVYLAQRFIEENHHMQLQSSGVQPYEITIGCIAILISALVALIPAMMAYRVNVAAVLSKGG